MKTSGPADFKSAPGFENQPRVVGVIEQNKISQTFFHYCMFHYIRVYMEAVKLESLQGTGLPGLNNLLIAQETLGSVVVVSCTSPPVVVCIHENLTFSNLFNTI